MIFTPTKGDDMDFILGPGFRSRSITYTTVDWWACNAFFAQFLKRL